MAFRDHVVWHKALLPALALPERFVGAWPGGIQNESVRVVVESYLEQFWEATDKGVAPLLVGPVGTWKTYAAAVVARFAHWQRVPTEFVQCGPAFARLDATYFEDEGRRVYAALARFPFLVLDDFTQVLPTGRGAEIMSNLVGERFASGLPTLVTGNIIMASPKDLQAQAQKWRPDFIRRLWHGSDGFRATLRVER